LSEFLEKILVATRESLESRRKKHPLSEIRANLPILDYKSLADAVAEPGVSIIAEIKRASPSKGMIRPDLDVAGVAAAYERAGARAVSVLTEESFFLGSLDDLRAARAACSLPVLRKDFIIDPYQVWEAAAAGADAILLIVAALTDDELAGLMAEAGEARLDCLVEVHDREELERALGQGARLVGVNNRDLRTFRVDLDTTADLIDSVPDGVLLVSESGISTRDDIRRLAGIGVDAFLIGEALMRDDDPEAKLGELLGGHDPSR